MDKLEIIGILKESYMFAYSNLETIVKRTWLAMAFFIGVSALYPLLLQSMVEQGRAADGGLLQLILKGASTWEQNLAFAVWMIALVALAFMLFTYVLQVKLKNDFSEPGLHGIFWDNQVTVVAVSTLAVKVIFWVCSLSVLPLMLIHAGGTGTVYIVVLLLTAFAFIGLLGGFYLTGRLMLAIPESYMNMNANEAAMVKSWQLTSNKVLSIYAVIFGMILPIFAVTVILNIFLYLITLTLGMAGLGSVLAAALWAIGYLALIILSGTGMATIYTNLNTRRKK